MSPYLNAITDHYSAVWGTPTSTERLGAGNRPPLSADFHILVFAPRSARRMWTYATCGMSEFKRKDCIEIYLFSPVASPLHVETLTSIAHFHAAEGNLGIGHTVNIGRPWLDESKCQYALVSLPYLDGPTIEHCGLNINGREAQCLWLIPITHQERDYKAQHGLNALEERFQSAKFNYLDPKRQSVV